MTNKICKDISVEIKPVPFISWTDSRTGNRHSAKISTHSYFDNDADVDIRYDMELIDFLNRSRPKFGGASYFDLVLVAAQQPAKQAAQDAWKLHRRGAETVSRLVMEAACMCFAVDASEAFEESVSEEPWIAELHSRIDAFKAEIEKHKTQQNYFDAGLWIFPPLGIAVRSKKSAIIGYCADMTVEYTDLTVLGDLLDEYRASVVNDFVEKTNHEQTARQSVLDHFAAIKKKPEFMVADPLSVWIEGLEHLIEELRVNLIRVEHHKSIDGYHYSSDLYRHEFAIADYVYAVDRDLRFDDKKHLSKLLMDFAAAVRFRYSGLEALDDEVCGVEAQASAALTSFPGGIYQRAMKPGARVAA